MKALFSELFLSLIVSSAREAEELEGVQAVDTLLDEYIQEASFYMDSDGFFLFNQMKHGAWFGSWPHLFYEVPSVLRCQA